MPKVILINPSISTFGYSFFTPRWLYVIACATPADLVGKPVLVDESLAPFDPDVISPGDIVGIGISSGNCIQGYRALRQAKEKGATVIMGGVHPTIFPDEPLEMGADAVVTGNGDVIWSRVVRDCLDGALQRHYAGGRLPGDAMLKASWELLDSERYLFPTVQTVAGCPENCSFCSVWVTDGRQPRQRLAEKVIEEVNDLYALGFRWIAFADDNFNPATLPRIRREPSPLKRKEFEKIREERLQFFEEYDRTVPKDIFAMTQMTSEIVGDEEYLSAMREKMRIRAALIGVESFSEEGLKTANKRWNPSGQAMVETIRQIQERGILVLSSIICGLESDTLQTLQTMREFATSSGALLAQFTFYAPYPGTKDFYEMLNDKKNAERENFIPKRRVKLLEDRYWLNSNRSAVVIDHPHMSLSDLVLENRKCWNSFYSVAQIFRRIRSEATKSWPLPGKITYFFACVAFRRVYAGHGVSADSVNVTRTGLLTRILVRAGIAVYSCFFRRRGVSLKVALSGSKICPFVACLACIPF